jgi:hypothetical protein
MPYLRRPRVGCFAWALANPRRKPEANVRPVDEAERDLRKNYAYDASRG